jgi:serine/threonine protein kinase, bacterial
MGTPAYLAPEVINGADPNTAADVYAAGITLYELLAGEPPFGGHFVAVMHAHLQKAPERPPAIPDGLWELIAAALSKDPAGRPAAADLARALHDIAASPVTPAPPRQRSCPGTAARRPRS